MNGIILVNKPKDYSSHDVVNVLRRYLKTKKIGHTGTLDPDATGLLVLGVNHGTKIIKYLNNDIKEYIAEICIGSSTETLDKTGEVIDTAVVKDLENVDEVIASFKGIYTQTPPMYSAIKYQGKRLYEYARKGITIPDIPSRDIEVFDIERISDIVYKEDKAYFSYRVLASKGLYVRTLSYDIGKKLGYPSHNYELHRTKAGKFKIEDSYTLEEIEKGNYKLISLPDALDELQTVVIHDDFRHHIKNGMAISLRYFNKHTLTKIVDEDNNLLAIYDKHPTEPKMKAINIYKRTE
ncbi:tRNA pseudouridine synthase B [Candidatus Izimaplasma bacterium HR1]|jgi:tRNA pseudouridine55 synthase|uniref:tRNA pseudouridine(55) synthase TruB n=1 Tax=Candidatus Izimoplasma sp. HR1 TaxID=1541959 RepID=UPI0004F92300|nr:tRNA pseudouridine synthase B [Candidatus Izimaplasma bacterium HR1]